MTIPSSGTNHIDALQTGYSWTGTVGVAYRLAYAFAPSDGVVPSSMRSAYVAATKVWENVANITFQATSFAVSKLDFYHSDLSSLSSDTIGVTYQYLFGSSMVGAQVALDDRFTTAASVAKGTLGFLTLVHEIGHAIGLKHPQNYGGSEPGPYLPAQDDTLNASVMSYYESAQVGQTYNVPITPMIYDIAAMQYLYGANYAYNSGATTYTITGAANAQTIWDGGGVDTISGVRLNSASVIDLREGLNNYSQIGNSYVWNAFGANIENATAGNGNDVITGNSLNNTLTGNGGSDVIRGGSGADRVLGGAGADNLFGDADSDTVDGGNDSDNISGGNGNDSLLGGAGNDYMNGDNGVDTIGGSDIMFGGAGNDSLYGDGGADFMRGEVGNDLLYGGAGNDSLFGDVGNDFMNGGNGSDVLDGGAGNDTLIGCDGNDTLIGGAGVDTFDFRDGGQGIDTIQRFEGAGVNGGDIIRLSSLNLSDDGFATLADLLAAVTYSSNTAVIHMGASDTITLTGVTRALTANDFLFG